MVSVKIGTRRYEFMDYSSVTLAKNLFEVCDSQEEFEQKLEEHSIKFYYDLW